MGQSGCVDQPWLPCGNRIPFHPPSPYGPKVYNNEREEIMETESEEDPGEDPMENPEEQQFMFSPEQSPAPIFGPRLPVYIEISSYSAMSLERTDSPAPMEYPIQIPSLRSQNQEELQ
ncbi:unnamed protein product [Arabis nemorensis]|uniref:Uncharacterized protein n=1 Tax=Arabis nemorensis TaxID=586526 RepID=A0A565AV37_9BRAS|nr:unnamed protein product [Arabis nemorensis]